MLDTCLPTENAFHISSQCPDQYLEYRVWFLLPHHRKNVKALEWVQTRFTRVLPWFVGINHIERLGKLAFPGMSWRGDLLDGYKIMKGIERVDHGNLFPVFKWQGLEGITLRREGKNLKRWVLGKFFVTLSNRCLEGTAQDVWCRQVQ